ncbi:MAG TPA: cellulase family glycosylhydrolase [Ktedonobacteraceae bacterium]|nr:cellulase family glycosylhydrolase [Ktedonobacteraceae bacterium]
MNNYPGNPRRNRNLIIFFVLLALAVLIVSFSLTYVFIINKNSSSTASTTPTPGPGLATCTGQGATKNADGSYSFSPLHINGAGQIVDAHNCLVRLVGMNMGALFLGSAGHPTPPVIAWYKQHIPMNIVREAFNTYWWQTDVNVPNAKMHYRAWLQTVVKWQEQSGNYVILDAATQFHNPPCGTGLTIPCPSQSQASKNVPPNPQEKSTYQPTVLSALTDLAKLYSRDPAIIFDVWNEPSNKEINGISMQTFFSDMNDRINTVRQYAPNAIVMVYQQGIDQLETAAAPDYTQKNILFDTHIYQGKWNPSASMPLVNFAHSHGQAVIVGEWGGVPGKPDPSVMIPFVKDNYLATCYFIANDLLTGNATNPTGLNSIGQAVSSGYGSVLGT